MTEPRFPFWTPRGPKLRTLPPGLTAELVIESRTYDFTAALESAAEYNRLTAKVRWRSLKHWLDGK